MPNWPGVRLLAILAQWVAGGCFGERVEPGDPCVPGARPIVVERDSGGDPTRVLRCAVDSELDCGAPVRPAWAIADVSRAGAIVNVAFCGCDGRTHEAWFDSSGQPFPDIPVRWFGTCEDPCAEVDYDRYLERFVFDAHYIEGPPPTRIAPQCSCADGSALADGTWSGSLQGDAADLCYESCLAAYDVDGRCESEVGEVPLCCAGCRDARYDADHGACVVGETISLAPDCCFCGQATRAPDGRCLDGSYEVADYCCDCALAGDACLDLEEGDLRISSACCDCSNAVAGPAGSCVDMVTGLELAPTCCTP